MAWMLMKTNKHTHSGNDLTQYNSTWTALQPIRVVGRRDKESVCFGGGDGGMEMIFVGL